MNEAPGTLHRILALMSPAKRQKIDEDIDLASHQAILREDKATVTITLELMPVDEGTRIDFTIFSVPKIPKSAAAIVRANVDAKGKVEDDLPSHARQRQNVVHIGKQ